MGWIYFIETEDGQFVKIGYSVDPVSRARALGQQVPGLRLLGFMPGDQRREHNLHSRWANERRSGEWFSKSRQLSEFIEGLPLKQSTEADEGRQAGGIVARRPKAYGRDQQPRTPRPSAVSIRANGREVPLDLCRLEELCLERRRLHKQLLKINKLIGLMNAHARGDLWVTVGEILEKEKSSDLSRMDRARMQAAGVVPL